MSYQQNSDMQINLEQVHVRRFGASLLTNMQELSYLNFCFFSGIPRIFVGIFHNPCFYNCFRFYVWRNTFEYNEYSLVFSTSSTVNDHLAT